MLIVQKYGGSSLKDAERLRHVAGLVRDRRGEAELVVVVSAMGGTTDRLTGQAREMSPEPSARELDALVTTGEQQSAALLVMTMEQLGLPAVSLTGWQASKCPALMPRRMISMNRLSAMSCSRNVRSQLWSIVSKHDLISASTTYDVFW